MIPGIDPKIDYAFKRIFGQPRNLEVVKHLLNAVLGTSGHAPVTDLELLNPFNDKETSDDKLSIVDLKARDQFGRHFNVEMQLLGGWPFPDRMVYYWSRLHSHQLHEGEDFTKLRSTFGIGFVDYDQFETIPDYHTCFRLRDPRHPDVVFSQHVEYHLLQLPKFQLAVEDLHTPLEQWVYFLRHGAKLDPYHLPPTLQVLEIRKALEELVMVTESERDWARYEDRFRAQLDARSFRPVIEEAGRQRGLQEGLQEGLQQGRKEKLAERLHWCQQLLQQPLTPLPDLLALSEEELQQQTNLLEQQVAAGFRPPADRGGPPAPA